MSNECKHGQLARSCEICEWERDEAEFEKRIAELEAQVAALESKLTATEARLAMELAMVQTMEGVITRLNVALAAALEGEQ